MHGWFEQCSYWFGRTPIGGAMFVFGILILIALGFLVYLAAGNRGRNSPLRKEDPVAILKSRYARGEITREEYQVILDEVKK